ncbi:MAG: hypothetical protein LQ352_000133 [Teloschistes flavicans]|nr:MAG: hypothetical protein LQ352_000133 [Teloschistes flavicans]
MKKCVPLWATQGIRYQRRHMAWSRFLGGEGKRAAPEIAKSLLEAEAQTLQDRYGFEGPPEEKVLFHNVEEESLLKRETQLDAIRAKCREFELASFSDATLQEEQERELSPENEQERQVELPPKLIPYVHSVHRDVKRFVHQGFLDRDSNAFQPAFELLRNTSASECLEVEMWPVHLLVTADFARTVHASENQHLDSFLRPVHWVAIGKNHNTVECVVLSPYEAHELLPSIRQHKKATLHVYSPRVSMSVRTLEDLSFCAIPGVPQSPPHPLFIMQLNLFAGQLYLKSYEEYLSVCRFLGLCFRPPYEQIQVACDGFVSPESRLEFDAIMEKECPFLNSPVGFLRMLMALRRKGQNFQRSHFGRILRGDLLAREQIQ